MGCVVVLMFVWRGWLGCYVGGRWVWDRLGYGRVVWLYWSMGGCLAGVVSGLVIWSECPCPYRPFLRPCR